MRFGGDGAFFWSESRVNLHPLQTIRDGESVLRTWSDLDAETGLRQIYLQIIHSDASWEFESPIRLSRNDWRTTLGFSTSDENGNIFVAWHSVNPEDQDSGELYAQKFNSQGEAQWGEGGLLIRDAIIVYPNMIFSGRPDEWVIEDYRGGCYVICNSGFTAINSDGELRENWRLNDAHLPRNQTLYRVDSDGAGGFLYKVQFSEDRTDGENKISYDGESLFEIPTFTRVEGLPGNAGVHWIAGYNGGAICQWFSGEERGLCVVDDEYHLIENRFINASCRIIERNYLILQDGSYVFRFDANQSSYAIRYDPESNSLPWGEEGIQVCPIVEDRWVSTWTSCEMTELTNGNLIIPYGIWNFELHHEFSCNIYCITPDGEQVWQSPIFVDWLGSPRYVEQAPDGEFWLAGDKVNSGTIRNYPYFLLKSDLNGNVIHENIDQSVNHRDIAGIQSIKPRPNGQYDLHFSERDGLRVIRMNWDGTISDPPQGELLIEADPLFYSYRYNVNCSRHNIFAWFNNAKFFASLNDHGDLVWSTQVDCENNWNPEYAFPPNNDILYFSMYDYVDDIHQSTITAIDLNNGEIICQSPIINHGNDVKKTFVVAVEESIFDIVDSRRSGVIINKLDLQGRQVWQEPFHLNKHANASAFGAFASTDGNFWIGLHQTVNGEFNTWVRKISTANGDVIDSLSLMQDPIRIDDNFRNRHVYKTVSVNYNVWFLPMRVPGIDGVEQSLPIFCMTRDGEVLSGASGINLISPNGQNNEHIQSKPDELGGLWLAWRRPNQEGSEDKTFVTHIDEQCTFNDPWTRTGTRVFPDVEMDERLLDIEVIDENSIGVVSRLQDRALGDHFRFQIVSSEPFQSAGEYPVKPVDDFRITSISPNPFNSSTKLTCRLPRSSNISINIYDVTGRLAESYAEDLVQAGEREFTIDCTVLGTGLYFVRIESDYGMLTRKIMVLR